MFDGQVALRDDITWLQLINKGFVSMFDGQVALRDDIAWLRLINECFVSVFDGQVALRDWTSPDYELFLAARQKKRKNQNIASNRVKTKLCFFYTRHPDGCPLTADSCRFAHGQTDLKERID